MNKTFELKPEDELLICCARTQLNSDTKKKIRYLIKKDLKWDYILEMASGHALRPLLFFHLSYVNLEDVPKNFMDILKGYFYMNARKNLLMLAELLKILKLLEFEGITAIPYKGPIMAVNLYGDLSLREFADLDIFIDKKDVINVKEILVSMGYETKLMLDKKKELSYLKSQREYQFTNKENGISVEIQWNLADISLSFPQEPVFTMDQFKTGLTKINNHEISSFSDEDLLLILSLHTVTHLWSKLSWVCDIAELIKNSKGLNWDEIVQKSRYLAVERIVYLNLALVNEIFDIKLPRKIMEKIDDDKIVSLKYDVMTSIFDNEKFTLIQKICLRFKIREKRINRINDFIRIIKLPTSTEWKKLENQSRFELMFIIKWSIRIIAKIRK